MFWKEAIKVEIDSLLQNQTWEIIDWSSSAKPIGYKWIFKRKYFHDGSINKYKARLVIKSITKKTKCGLF